MPDAGRRTVVEIRWRTLLRLIAALALVWLCVKLYQIILLIVVAIVLAVALEPLVAWLQRRRVPRVAGVLIVTLALLALVGGFIWMTWASLSAQAGYAATHFGELADQAQQKLPGWMRSAIDAQQRSNATSAVARYAVTFAQSLTSAIIVGVLGFILTIYLLVEGRQTIDWLLAFVPRAQHPKAERTLDACRDAIVGYMVGNVATSICAFIFAIISLSLLNVPAALLLAVCAFVFDFVPVIGLILSSAPAIILAATVSPRTALVVTILYAAYHTTENYLIAPYVYGDRLKLSNVVVIVAFAVGAELAGVIGALIALPVAAIYPAIERIWLRDTVGEETVKEHRAIERRAG